MVILVIQIVAASIAPAPLFRDRSCHYRYAAATGLTTHAIQKSGAERKQCLAAEIGFGL
jgi:hypothetical protein